MQIGRLTDGTEIEVDVDEDTAALSRQDFPDIPDLQRQVDDAQQALDNHDLKVAKGEFPSGEAERKARERCRKAMIDAQAKRDQADRLTERIKQCREDVDGQYRFERHEASRREAAQHADNALDHLEAARKQVEEAMKVRDEALGDVRKALSLVPQLAQGGHTLLTEIKAFVPHLEHAVRRDVSVPALYGPEKLMHRTFSGLLADHGKKRQSPPKSPGEIKNEQPDPHKPETMFEKAVGRPITEDERKKMFSRGIYRFIEETKQKELGEDPKVTEDGYLQGVRRRPQGAAKPVNTSENAKEATAA